VPGPDDGLIKLMRCRGIIFADALHHRPGLFAAVVAARPTPATSTDVLWRLGMLGAPKPSAISFSSSKTITGNACSSWHLVLRR
jgi:hypothetical protein